MLSHDLSSTVSVLNTFIITFQPPLPLAMYYELQSHIGQIGGVIANLVWQNHDYFDYEDSQIAAIMIESEFSLELDWLSKSVNAEKTSAQKKVDQNLNFDLTSLSFLFADSSLCLDSAPNPDLQPSSQTLSQADCQVRNKLLGLILSHYGNWQIKDREHS